MKKKEKSGSRTRDKRLTTRRTITCAITTSNNTMKIVHFQRHFVLWEIYRVVRNEFLSLSEKGWTKARPFNWRMQRELGGEPDSYRHWIVFDVVWPFLIKCPTYWQKPHKSMRRNSAISTTELSGLFFAFFGGECVRNVERAKKKVPI